MSLRTTFTRSLRSAPSSSARLAPSSRVLARGFIRPTNAVQSAEDEEKHRAAYEKHRVEVDPKMASVDENMTFTPPTVSSPLLLYRLAELTRIEMGQRRPRTRCRWGWSRKAHQANARLVFFGRKSLRRHRSCARSGQHDGPYLC